VRYINLRLAYLLTHLLVGWYSDVFDSDRCFTQLNMRQSKVARSFEAQRRNPDGENEALTEREAESQRRGPRDQNNYATRSNARLNVSLRTVYVYTVSQKIFPVVCWHFPPNVWEYSSRNFTLPTLNFVRSFIGQSKQKSMKNLGKVAVGVVRESRKYSEHPYGVHCAVIFAIAQLSCFFPDNWDTSHHRPSQ